MAKSKTEAVTRSRGVQLLFIAGVLALLITGYLWCRLVINSPRNVFNTMLENSLSTSSVAKRTLQESGAQTLDQTSAVQSGANKIAHSVTTLSQKSIDTATVKTESIGTPISDYVRYTDIQTSQTKENGEPLDFGDVLGYWGRSSGGDGTTSGELYGETVLGIVPFGYLPQARRQEVMNLIREKKVYDVDYSSVKRETRNGRPVYTYKVEVAPENYVEMLKAFARAVGLNQLEAFDSSSFKQAPKLEFSMTVDVWSKQLVSAEYVNSGRAESYLSFGAKVPLGVPDKSISVEELQSRLQSVQ